MKTTMISLLFVSALVVSLAGREPEPPEKAFTNSIGMKLVRIPGGEFVMGQGDAPPRTAAEWAKRDADEAPAHKVKITTSFHLGAHEVTNAQYEQFDPEHKKQRGTGTDTDPVAHVTWQQAVDFCAWLSKKEGKPYRLPTEAEWEYACQAGTTTPFSTGEALTREQANFGFTPDGLPLHTAVAVGSYKPSAWGLYDMHGNVAEWCLDWYGPYVGEDQVDPVGSADGDARVTRGWSFLSPAFQDSSRLCRSANRSGCLPEDANECTGFRVVRGEMPATRPLPVIKPPHQQDVKQAPAPKDGPDPNKPYFLDFTAAGKNPTIPPNTWGPIFSKWNHFAAVCACPNGDILAAWYSTVGEAGRELSLACSRLRVGSERWDAASVFFDVPDVNDHAPVLLSDGKRIYHFCLQALRGWDNASIILRTSDDSGATWSKARIILSRDAPDRMSQPCSAFVGKDGTLFLACDGDQHKDERLLLSSDGGKTWKVGKGDLRATLKGKYVIHPAAAPLEDGSILAFGRGPDPMPVFVTKDRGESWEARSTPFPGIGVGQKAAAVRLASGALLLCAADNKKTVVGGGTYAALSLDEGKTWAHVRKVDGVAGYMAATQAANGVIYLFGTRMGCAAFNETWLREGK
jgi:formylglycine-generating enzyme